MTTVTMGKLFPACVRYLRNAFQPVHYAKLTKAALELIAHPYDNYALIKAKKDVREKMLLKKRYGTCYIGKPYFAGVCSDWFPNAQLPLWNTDIYQLKISVDAHTGWYATEEFACRLPYLITKFADTETRYKSGVKGYWIENHVSSWFKQTWPDLWMPADNKSQYKIPCNHDFKLRLPHKIICLDVMGPNREASFGLSPGKQPTDYHLCASFNINHWNITLCGFLTYKDLITKKWWSVEQIRPISQLLVWINCINNNLNYKDIRMRVHNNGDIFGR